MKIIVIIFAIVLAGCNPHTSKKKYDQIVTKYTEIKKIISEEVNDTFYVFIRLPKDYNVNPNKRYPVLYLLDGDISFNMATSVVRYLQFGKDIPDLIIVAPAYGTLLNDCETNFRERDYTISEVEKFANSGGGENYLEFLQNELLPIIDSSFRTTEKRILNGYSLGGLFTLNTLINKSELFTDYIAGSPYLRNDLELLLDKSEKLNLSLSKKVFLSIGEFEDKQIYYDPIFTLYNSFSEHKKIKSKLRVFENGTHFTCPPEALAYGLKFVFEE